MPISPDDFETLKNDVIKDAIKSVKRSKMRDYHLRGALAGLEIARTLNDREDFETVIKYRNGHEAKLQQAYYAEQKPELLEQYWEYRHASVQISSVYEHLKVIWPAQPTEVYSAKAYINMGERLQRKGLIPRGPSI